MSASGSHGRGTLIISLDFELRWGVLNRCPAGAAYERSLLEARRLIPRMVEIFERESIAATWATVGMLFARNREELEAYRPRVVPAYDDVSLDCHRVKPGRDEASDPLHYAASLVELLRDAPHQEVGTHTFSHYYCTEPGQTTEAFRADLEAALKIAALRGVTLRSIVFPRNQHNPAYDPVLADAGITAYRGNVRSWMWRFAQAEESATPGRRLGRLMDSYLPLTGSGLVPWNDLPQPHGLSDVRASGLLRAWTPSGRRFEGLRLRRIRESMEAAARAGSIYHLWWHPHNFGAHPDQNLAFLGEVLAAYRRCHGEHGMISMSMADAAKLASAAAADTVTVAA
jgi:peptidoglycan/xylan/chitin deacetylase (PgdA/CDA1 family)